jgi:hypothetical protein
VYAQELRLYLQTHRSWLSGVWTASASTASFEGRKEQGLLLSQLLGSLLKCCDSEVGLQRALKDKTPPTTCAIRISGVHL